MVICGPGNNGGDGFIIANGLKNIGWPVELGLLGDKQDLDNDARRASQLWKGEIQKLSIKLVDNADLIVDALFGAGLNREVSGISKEIITIINKKKLIVYQLIFQAASMVILGRFKGALSMLKLQ